MARLSPQEGFPNVRLIPSRRRKKTLSVRVDTDGTVIVRVPWRYDHGEVHGFLRRHAGWIDRQVRRAAESARLSPPAAGTKAYPYLGRLYPLAAPADQAAALAWSPDKGFSATVTEARVLERLLRQWYIHRAHETIPGRVLHFAGIMGLSPKKVRISGARSRWGSCSGRDTLSFSWRTVTLPAALIDYIVIHELAHLKERNHGPRFWHLVSRFMPDHKSHRARLRQTSHSFPAC